MTFVFDSKALTQQENHRIIKVKYSNIEMPFGSMASHTLIINRYGP